MFQISYTFSIACIIPKNPRPYVTAIFFGKELSALHQTPKVRGKFLVTTP
jgi:hypothetical protein